MTAPVLDLTAVFERPKVKLPDGSDVELRNQEEFSVLEWHRIVKLDKEAAALKDKIGESEDAAEKAAALQRDLVAMLVVDLPDGELPDWACARILAFWTENLPGGDDPSPPPTGRRTTGGSSRGSKRSTAATRKPGSPTSRAGR